jgi:hypothetical protein
VTPAPRSALVIILAQAWAIGAVLGTLLGLMIAAPFGDGEGAGFGFFSILVAFVALMFAAVPFAAGLVLAMAAPRWVLRHRTILCAALPVVVGIGWVAVKRGPDFIGWMLFIAVLDAAIAAAWVWWRTRALLPLSPREVARVFE